MTKEELDAALEALPPATSARASDSDKHLSPSAKTMMGIFGGAAAPVRETPTEQDLARRAAMHAQARLDLRKRCVPKLAAMILRSVPRTMAAVLLGPSGCGKTQAAKFLCLGRRATWVKGADLSMAEREHRLGMGEPPAVLEARACPMLVIDDVRAGQDVGSLWRIIDHRYDRGLPMIVTSGLRQFELLQHIGAAGVRRLIEQHCGHPVLGVNCHDSDE